MPAKHHIDDEASLIITTWDGDVTDSEFIAILQKYQKDIQCKADYINYNEIFDIRNAAIIKLTIDGLLKIGRTASKTDHLFTYKKLAFVVNSNRAFALARMYGTLRNMGLSSSKKMRVFKDINKAIAWAEVNTNNS